jgi:hypothetical protein
VVGFGVLVKSHILTPCAIGLLREGYQMFIFYCRHLLFPNISADLIVGCNKADR